MRIFFALCLSACAATNAAAPGRVPAVAMSSAATREAAEAEIKERLSTRVQQLERGIGFLLERPAGGKVAMKLAVEPMKVEVAPEIIERASGGYVGRVPIVRSEETREALTAMRTLHGEARVAGKDLGKGLARAEREILRDVAVKVAEREGRKDTALNGRATIVSYTIADEGSSILVGMDVAIDYDIKKKAPASEPVSQPTTTPAPPPPVKKQKVLEQDEPDD
ncbi:MAG: hypothetical protein IT381_12610 [Deltaproteobacteria bacterium]|nr:hypothetical protein [Deltaproteobacteria bacterium]